MFEEKVLTRACHGHILTNTGCWSLDSRWIVYDVRSDPAGDQFDGAVIERVNVATGEVHTLYEATDGAHCGVVTCSPVDNRIVFIHGPEHPDADWYYTAWHRRGVLVDTRTPGTAITLDARDLTPPFTPGALRGGTHVHVFSGDGRWVSSTYEDHVLAQRDQQYPDQPPRNQRNIAVTVLGRPVTPLDHPDNPGHPRNHGGVGFSVVVSTTEDRPVPGSDQIQRACSDAWVGQQGYLRPDGSRQLRAIAFQGTVVSQSGEPHNEVFIVDLPNNLEQPGDDPLAGTETTRPAAPAGVVQRRLTYTDARSRPGLQGPRHWLRSSPDGARIAFLMADNSNIIQLWWVSPSGGDPVQITRNPASVASAFSWSPDGQNIAYVMDNSVFTTRVDTGESQRLTPRSDDQSAPRPLACVYSPDGSKIAFMRLLPAADGNRYTQVCWVAAA